MRGGQTNVRNKIINDPVHGFITIQDDVLLQLLDHPWLQRLRRIRQLGMTNLVYPGAQHTRLQHAIGAMHLMQMALETLQQKGVFVLPSEQQAAMAAMMLHDAGHGPFSHALEKLIVDADHEDISRLVMQKLNEQMNGALSACIDMFNGKCRPFLHQLISSQLDTDRLDYLRRDSFFTGVVEGAVGAERLIKMLDVTPNEHLAVEAKGIFSIEDFLVARRLMYWQVYLHKTVVAAEKMLRLAINRARELTQQGQMPSTAPTLAYFLKNKVDLAELTQNPEAFGRFMDLDDDDVTTSLKEWQHSPDVLLSLVAHGIVNRRLFRIELSREPFDPEIVEAKRLQVTELLNIPPQQAEQMVITGQISSKTYTIGVDRINIISTHKEVGRGVAGGTNVQIRVRDISEASDMMRLETLGNTDRRHYLCYPRLDPSAKRT